MISSIYVTVVQHASDLVSSTLMQLEPTILRISGMVVLFVITGLDID